jgi:hypothetical protein
VDPAEVYVVPETNGLRATVNFLMDEVKRLRDGKANSETVAELKEDIQRLEKAIDGLRDSFGGLMKAILVACVVWALGSAGFLIGVLQWAAN